MNQDDDDIDAENSRYYWEKAEQIGIAFWITVATIAAIGIVAFLIK